jgi:DNA-binding MarR family transcriptional regulator
MATTTDAVDEILEQWRHERPDLDPSPMGVIGRLSRVGQILDRQIAEGLVPFNLEPSEFDLLATLRRHGKPYELTAGELMTSAMLTSGAITQRIDRLEAKGLVKRIRDNNDRRVVRVRLEPAGVKLINLAVEGHLANEERILQPLSQKDRNQLASLLRRLLASSM